MLGAGISIHKKALLLLVALELVCSLVACRKSPVKAGPTAKWTLHIGPSNHPLALDQDGTIYALLDSGVLMAIDPSGTTKWSQQAAAPRKLAIGPAIGSDGAIYVVGHNHLAIFNPDGSTRTDMYLGTSARSGGMALTGDRLYAQCMRAGLCAINLAAGMNVDWHVSEGALPIVQPDGTVIFGFDSLVAIRSSPQLPQWIFPRGGSLDPDSDHSGWFDISPMGYAHLGVTGLSAANDGTIYVCREVGLSVLDSSGQVKWEFAPHPASGQQALVAADGTIYVASDDRHLYALRPDGKVLWKIATTGLTGQPLLGSAGTIFFMDTRTLHAVGADGRNKWTLDLDSLVMEYSQIGIPSLSDDGTLYIVTRAGTLYAIPVGESLMHSAWPKFQANLRNSGQVNQ